MKIEELIQLHNQALNREVEENIYLDQRIKARLKDKNRVKRRFWIPLKKTILVYSFLLIFFTVLNLIIIGGLKKQPPPLKPEQQIVLTMNVFSPSYPASISQAYREVMK